VLAGQAGRERFEYLGAPRRQAERGFGRGVMARERLADAGGRAGDEDAAR
jgi:hypothetical protein